MYLFSVYLLSVLSPNFPLGNFVLFCLQYLLFSLALISTIHITLITSLETYYNHHKEDNFNELFICKYKEFHHITFPSSQTSVWMTFQLLWSIISHGTTPALQMDWLKHCSTQSSKHCSITWRPSHFHKWSWTLQFTPKFKILELRLFNPQEKPHLVSQTSEKERSENCRFISVSSFGASTNHYWNGVCNSFSNTNK